MRFHATMACLREHYGDQINCRYVGRGKLPQKESVVVYLGNEFRTCLPRHCWTPMERGSSWTEFSTFIPREPFLLGEEKRSDGNDDSLGCKNGAAPAGDKPGAGAGNESDDGRLAPPCLTFN